MLRVSCVELRLQVCLLLGLVSAGCDDKDEPLHDASLLRDADSDTHDADAGHADALIDAGCAHYSALSGICDDPAVIARCETLGIEACAAEGCRVVSGRALQPQQHCLQGYQFAGCTLAPEGCSTSFTYALDADGGAWQLLDSCMPTRWHKAPLGAFADAGTWTTCLVP